MTLYSRSGAFLGFFASPLLLVVLGVVPARAQFAIRVAAGDYATSPGQNVTVPIEVESPEPVSGFSFGVSHDGAKLSLQGVGRGAALDAALGAGGPDMRFYSVNMNPAGGAGFTVAVILGPEDPAVVLPAGMNTVFEAEYQAAANASGDAVVSVTDQLGSPPVSLVIDVGGGQAQVVQGSQVTVSISVPFRRGDVNQDGNVNITDAVRILRGLFGGLGTGDCPISFDTDGDSQVVLSDAVFLLTFLFRRGVEPPPPFQSCGQPADPIPAALLCRQFTPCGAM